MVDVQGLIDHGCLDLERAFDKASWKVGESVATYNANAFGYNEDEPGQALIFLQTATKFGITAYRWYDPLSEDNGPACLDPKDARDGAKRTAEKRNDP